MGRCALSTRAHISFGQQLTIPCLHGAAVQGLAASRARRLGIPPGARSPKPTRPPTSWATTWAWATPRQSWPAALWCRTVRVVRDPACAPLPTSDRYCCCCPGDGSSCMGNDDLAVGSSTPGLCFAFPQQVYLGCECHVKGRWSDFAGPAARTRSTLAPSRAGQAPAVVLEAHLVFNSGITRQSYTLPNTFASSTAGLRVNLDGMTGEWICAARMVPGGGGKQERNLTLARTSARPPNAPISAPPHHVQGSHLPRGAACTSATTLVAAGTTTTRRARTWARCWCTK